MTIRKALAAGAGILAPLDFPQLEAGVLLCHALSFSREKMYASLNQKVDASEYHKYLELLEKRHRGVPSAYLVGSREFYSRNFIVNEHVLVPRPDTEVLVDTAIALFGQHHMHTLLDLCTGSGCIAITLYHELPGAALCASDISEQAAGVFAANCRLHEASITFFHSDLFDAVKGRFDLIVSNPPYLCNHEVDEMETAGLYEPSLALRAGADGLDFFRRIIVKSMDYLTDNGYLVLEAGPDQCRTIADLLHNNAYSDISIRKDLAGRDRVITGKRNGNAA
ncbi:MAG: peptide chain release factor N(5)-glutamine methyltransferase [Spirochaetales bacterium]|nr:peptide chain release factor N(5)-glutamine methyltransferase [Spirochaetales bacterium]